jgi:SPP1 family predicted phage head-tail adaptor|nr:MAG TPA: Putative head tail adaptor [Caudoviricetes sp.]
MRAGLLNERIAIYRLEKTRSPTGAEIKNYVQTHEIKANRKKLSSSVGSGVNASEEFIGNTLVFQVRKYSFLNDDVRIKYVNHFYKIISLDPQNDNTYIITCSKVNE